MELRNYCAICGRRIEVGETCYGVTKSGADLVVGDSICKDCLEIENQPVKKEET